jgi:tetratricopeptide (TPR) repeat protein
MFIRLFIAATLVAFATRIRANEDAHAAATPAAELEHHANAVSTAPEAEHATTTHKAEEHGPAAEKKEEPSSAHDSHAPAADHKAPDSKSTSDAHGKDDSHKTNTHGKADHAKAGEHGAKGKGSHKSEDPDEPTAGKMLEVLRSQVRFQSPEVSEALANAIIKMAPRSAEAAESLLLLARTATSEKRYGDAIIYYEQWRLLVFEEKLQTRETPIALLELGRAYRNIGALRIANETFYLVATTSRNVEKSASPIVKLAQWEVAETTFEIRDWERARKLYEMFIGTHTTSDPLSHSAFYRIAECEARLGNEDQEATSYQQALTYSPKHPKAAEAHFALMNIYLNHKNYPMASDSINLLSKSVAGSGAQEILSWKERVGESLFHHMFADHSYEYAENILDSLANMDPSTSWQQQVKRWRALSSLAEGKFETAVDLLPKPNASQPATAEALEAAIVAEQKERDDSQATLQSYAETAQWILDFKKKQRDLELYVTPDFQKPKTSL